MSAPGRHTWNRPPWTKNDVAPIVLSEPSKRHLQKITNAFRSVNETVIREAERAYTSFLKEQAIEAKPHAREREITEPAFNQGDIEFLRETSDSLARATTVPVNDGCAGILHVLADTECLPVWRRAVYSFLTYQGSHYGTVSWKLSKQRAQDILEDRDKIVELFEAVDDELRNLNADDTYDGIFEKIKLLERFKAVYNNQPSPATMEDRPSPEPHYSLQPLRRRNKVIPRGPGESRPVSKLHQPDASRSNLFGAVSIYILATSVPIGFAWKYSTNVHGTRNDVDFFLTIQNSAVTCLGILLTIYPSFRLRKSSARNWAHAFASLGVLCAVAAPVIYVHVPLMWSATLGLLSSMVQVFMTVQLALDAESTRISDKLHDS